MEKLLVLFFFLMLAAGLPQNKIDSDSAPDLEVRRFSWSHFQGSSANHGIHNERTEKVDADSRRRAFKERIENDNSIENRSRDMRDFEDSVARESISTKPANTFRYSVELRNTGTKVIKWIYLDYQISDPFEPDNASHRQFACAVKIKPNATYLLEAFTTFPPRRVVSATSTTTAATERVTINRVEYSDDGFWQRMDWHRPEQLPSMNNASGRCRTF